MVTYSCLNSLRILDEFLKQTASANLLLYCVLDCCACFSGALAIASYAYTF